MGFPSRGDARVAFASRPLIAAAAAVTGSFVLLASNGALAASPAVTFTGAYGGGNTTLTFTISNNTGTTLSNGAYAYNAAPNTTFVVALPTNTCGGGQTVSAGQVSGNTITLAGNSSCTVTYQVTSTVPNPTLSASNLTYTGADGASPSALAAPTPVPTLSQWALAVLASLMAGGGALAIRRKSLRA